MRLEVLEDRRLPATITVNTTADDLTPDSTLSLREAIEVSDGTLAIASLSSQEQSLVTGTVSATNTIDFHIPTSDPGYDATTGVWTIAVHSQLPTISTNAAIVDAYTQPGSTANTLAQADNAKLAVAISGTGQGTIDGLDIAAAGSQVFGLDIENFGGTGVVITADGNAQLAGCFVGIDPSGEKAAANGTGVAIENSSNLVGGPNLGDRNVISGNTAPSEGDGIYLPEQALNPLNLVPTLDVVENNFIGIDAAGTKSISNSQAGVADFGTENTYGGSLPGLGNVISGNGAGGLKSDSSITIEGNYVGTNATGTVALGNGPAGFGITNAAFPATQTITTIISGNLVSGNLQGGIAITVGDPSTSVYTVSNNKIGTNADGNAVLGDTGSGLELESVENATVTNNLIGGNTVGIQLSGFGSNIEHDVFQGNAIGTDVTGSLNLGNLFTGVSFSNTFGTTFGGTGAGQGNLVAFNGGIGIELNDGGQNEIVKNVIFNNGGNGIVDVEATQDEISQNSIYGNSGAGIHLTQDGNLDLPAPTLSSTPAGGGSVTLKATVSGSPSDSYVVEIFSNPTSPAAGHEQGKQFIEALTIPGGGSSSVNLPLNVYTATVTDPNGNTSPFSLATGSVGLPATVTLVSSSMNPSPVGQLVTFTAVVTAPGSSGTPTGSVIFTFAGEVQFPADLQVVGGVDEAQLSSTLLPVGPDAISAAYSGDANFSPSTGSLPTQTVTAPTPIASTTTVSSSLNPSTLGQPVTFTAVVAAPGYQGTPTGTVTFTIDGQAQLPTPVEVVGSTTEAQVTTSTLSVGPHSVSAAFSGDTNLDPSSGMLPTQTVNAAPVHPTTITVSSSLNPSTVGQLVTFTALVSPGAFAGTPAGMVVFTIDGTTEPPVSLEKKSGFDLASFSIATLTAGKHAINATYDGDTTFSGSTTPTSLIQTVNPLNVATNGGPLPPPTVVAVQRYGVHMQPTVLVLTFSDALDPARTVDLNNYKIVGPAGRLIGISSAVYDSALDSVTLKPRTRINLHHTYHLEVFGAGTEAVTDAHGTPLDGENDGVSGSNFMTTLTWRNVVLTPAEASKLAHGKHAGPRGALVHNK